MPASAAPAPATAAITLQAAAKAPAKVTIRTIASPPVKPGGTAVIKPSIALSGPVRVSETTLKVVQGKKTVVSGKRSAKLKAGTYTVTTTVKYWLTDEDRNVVSDRKTISRKQTLTVAPAVTVGRIADMTATAAGTATVRPNVKTANGTKTITSLLTVKQGTKTVALDQGSAALKPGRYKVTTTTKYRLPVYTTVAEAEGYLVMGNEKKAAKMTCTVSRIWPRAKGEAEYAAWIDMSAKCVGDFDDDYETFVYYMTEKKNPGQRWLGDRTAGQTLWEGPGNEKETAGIKPVIGSKATVTLFPRGGVFKRTNSTVIKKSWSPVYTATRTQDLLVRR